MYAVHPHAHIDLIVDRTQSGVNQKLTDFP
jgi:hypothetical protein